MTELVTRYNECGAFNLNADDGDCLFCFETNWSEPMDLNDVLPENFNAKTTVDEAGTGDYDALPAGWYRVRVERTEMKDTKAGTGKYLSVGFEVEGPRLEGRWIFENYNLVNPSEDAVRIGIEQFSRLCVCCGIEGRPAQMSELEGEVLDVKLKIERDPQWGDKNRVAAYSPSGSKVKPAGAQGAANNFQDDDVPF